MNQIRATRIVVGVGGGIAAYKSATLVSRLAQAGADVHVAMTTSGERFVGRATFAALSGNPVAFGSFDHVAGTTGGEPWTLGPHIEIARDASLMIVAPATANLIGNFAHGLAPDLVSTLYLQVNCPVLVAPAMSNHMWSKAAVQRNVAQVQEDGVEIIGPEEGWLSCREKGAGRMSDPESIADRAIELLSIFDV